MVNDFVTFKEKKYYVTQGVLTLIDSKITDITEIDGLDTLANLKELYLFYNEIDELRGLEKLTNLQILALDSNQITILYSIYIKL